MTSLNIEDLNWCVKRLPRKVKSLLKKYPGKLSVAGGYIRSCITGDYLKDIDLLTDSKETAKIVNKDLMTEDQRSFQTRNAYSILQDSKPSIHIIYRWTYSHPKEIIANFDFTICCAVIWFDLDSLKFKSEIHPKYYLDLAAKRLRYTAPFRKEEAGGSMLRVLKYYTKGYQIMLSSLAEVMTRACMGIEQIQKNIDAPQLSRVINGLLNEADPNTIPEDRIIEDDLIKVKTTLNLETGE